MNEYPGPSRTDFITKLYAVGANLERRESVYHRRIGNGLKHVARYLEETPGLDPYSNEFPGILDDLLINVKSRIIARKMRDDPRMTAAEATTKAIQVKGRTYAKRKMSH